MKHIAFILSTGHIHMLMNIPTEVTNLAPMPPVDEHQFWRAISVTFGFCLISNLTQVPNIDSSILRGTCKYCLSEGSPFNSDHVVSV